VAKAELMPDQSDVALPSILGAGGGALASLGALIGARQSIESDLTIARSEAVADTAADRLRSQGKMMRAATEGRQPDLAGAILRKKVDVEVLTGSVLQVSVQDHDPNFAKAAVGAYAQAIRQHLATISAEESTQKKGIAAERLADSSVKLARAQSALDQFRLTNRLAAPEIELGAAISLVTGLQAKLQADQATLVGLEKFATNDNIQVQAMRAEIDALKGQIAAAQARANFNSGPSVGAMTPKITEYENLYLNEKYAEAEYEIYKRYLDTVTVELLSADLNMSIIQPPYLDPDRHFNMHAAIALLLLLTAGALAEFYLARPPPGWTTREAK
jgi:capsule polysaccharide export protein KpsE/RkpR